VGSGTHAFQTGETMRRLEPVCLDVKPDAVLIYGDTNATLAGALVAAKLRVPLAHVEAGLRSFDRTMPEEVNRVVADRLSRWLFCPTDTAVRNLAAEGMAEAAHNVGDVMYDAALFYGGLARERSRALERLALEPGGYVLATIHRDFNTDRPDRLRAIVEGLAGCGRPVVFPVHPRTRKQIEAHGLGAVASAANLRLVEPVGYLDMVRLEAAAACIVTDSGGVQKEALFHGVPCVTVRPNTEWPETVAAGWNRLVEARAQDVAGAVRAAKPPPGPECRAFGDGQAAAKIARLLGA
jgi:UDP-N-acetylglucosamine 2-epimerase